MNCSIRFHAVLYCLFFVSCTVVIFPRGGVAFSPLGFDFPALVTHVQHNTIGPPKYVFTVPESSVQQHYVVHNVTGTTNQKITLNFGDERLLDILSVGHAFEIANLEGTWESGDSQYTVSTRWDGVDRQVVTARFSRVGPEAQELGFSTGDLAFRGFLREVDPFVVVQGDQIIRYASSIGCFTDTGRKVVFTAFLSNDEQRLSMDWYNYTVNPDNCEDQQVDIDRTVFDRVSGKGGE